MPLEFVISVNEDTFPDNQVFPKIYQDEEIAYNPNIYVKSSEGYQYKVQLEITADGLWHLSGPRWTEFCNRSLNVDVSLLHFVEEGDECFYVTGYDRDGIEIGGYGVNRATYSRFMTRVLPYPQIPQTLPAEFLPDLNDLDEIEIHVNGRIFRCNVRREEVMSESVYVLLGDTLGFFVNDLSLESGTICVFTKNRGKRLWLNAFQNDGTIITAPVFKGAATLRNVQLQLTQLEKCDERLLHVCCWPFHMDHFEEKPFTFYKRNRYIQKYDRLTVPAHFVKFHRLHKFKKALFIHQEYQDMFDVRMVTHKENPTRTNHVKIYGQWRILGQACRFSKNKMIRFRYMSLAYDLSVAEGEINKFPVFHIC